MNPNKKYTWNYEEFTIKYMSIANELKVGNYYINILLKRLPNVTVIFLNFWKTDWKDFKCNFVFGKVILSINYWINQWK